MRRPQLPGPAHPAAVRLAERPERAVPDRRHLPRLLPVQPGRAGARRHPLGPRQLDRPAALAASTRSRCTPRPGGSTPPAAGAAASSTTPGCRPRSTRPIPITPGTPASRWPAATARCSRGSRTRRPSSARRIGPASARSAIRSSSASRASGTRVQGAGERFGASADPALRLRRPRGLDRARSAAHRRRPDRRRGRATPTSGSARTSPGSTTAGCCWSRSGGGWTTPTNWPGCAIWSASLVRHPGGLRFQPSSGGVLDEGPAFYAPQLMADGDRTLLWGWSWELGRTRGRRSPRRAGPVS